MNVSERVRFLDRPEGRVSYVVTGDGPLVIAAPGMGDLRSSYRELLGPLVEAGFRVAVTDIRGHGDSDPAVRRHGDTATAEDLLALVDELGGPALLIGNSFAGSAAVIAAGLRPTAVSGLVLLAPFLREHGSAASRGATRVLLRVLFARPWGAAAWAAYYRGTLNRGCQAPWLAEHVTAIRDVMRDPRHLAAFRALATQIDHTEVDAHVAAVQAPALIVVGALDPDYPDAAGELEWMGRRLGATTLLVQDAAHYPHAQRPDVVTPAVLEFARAHRSGASWAVPRA